MMKTRRAFLAALMTTAPATAVLSAQDKENKAQKTKSAKPARPSGPLSGPLHRWVVRERKRVYAGDAPARMPQIVQLANRELLLCLQQGQPSKQTLVLRSQDLGKSWSSPAIASEECTLASAGGYGLTVLKSGRILMAYVQEESRYGRYEPVGELPVGNPLFRVSGFHRKTLLKALYSEDQGKTWKLTQEAKFRPFVYALPAGKIVELGNGKLAMPIHGALTEQDMDGNLESCGLVHSADGGLTWGEATVIAEADRQVGASYGQVAVLPLSASRWMATIRTDFPKRGAISGGKYKDPSGFVLDPPGHVSRTFSSNGGRSWSRPQHMVSQCRGVYLHRFPDGGVFSAHTSDNGILFELSYDEGESIFFQDDLLLQDSRQGVDQGSPSLVTLDATTLYAVYYRPGGKNPRDKSKIHDFSWIDGTWIRRVPWNSKQARERLLQWGVET